MVAVLERKKVKPLGTRKLSEVKKHLIIPEGIVDSNWKLVAPRCKEMGLGFDEWQRGAGKLILGLDKDGLYAATVGGVGISIPRQTGKTYLIGAIVFALCTLYPGLTVIWTSHHLKTTGETFSAMQGFAQRHGIAKYVDKPVLGKGDEAILFKNKSRILFGAREHGFGRGMSDVDILVCDEAQILSDKAMDAMLATMNTAENPLAFFMGTPPRPEDPSDAFTRMRRECLAGEVTDTLWIEMGADEDAARINPHDRNQWGVANPSFPHRTPVTAMKRMQRKLSPDSWLREGLGIWRAEDGSPLDLAKWAKPPMLNPQAEQPNRVCLVVATSYDRAWSSIGIAGEGSGSRTLVMCYSNRGTSWIASKIVELKEVRAIEQIALVGAQSKSVKTDLTQAGVDFDIISQVEEGSATATFIQAFKADAIEHVGQRELDTAVANARTRRIGEAEAWDSIKTSVDISPLRACSGAFYLWGLRTKIGIY